MPKATIAVNTKNSTPILTSGNVLNMIYTPGTMTSTTFTFLVSYSVDGIYCPLDDGSGNLYTVTFVAGRAVPVDASLFASVAGVIIVAGSTELTTAKELQLTLIPR